MGTISLIYSPKFSADRLKALSTPHTLGVDAVQPHEFPISLPSIQIARMPLSVVGSTAM